MTFYEMNEDYDTGYQSIRVDDKPSEHQTFLLELDDEKVARFQMLRAEIDRLTDDLSDLYQDLEKTGKQVSNPNFIPRELSSWERMLIDSYVQTLNRPSIFQHRPIGAAGEFVAPKWLPGDGAVS